MARPRKAPSTAAGVPKAVTKAERAKKPNWLKDHLADAPLENFRDVLDVAEPRPADAGNRAAKKNYAQRISEASAVMLANALRPYFGGILPRPDGTGQESRARTGKGVKKLDVNYSTPDLGLGLGVSVKTLNFRDPTTSRYTKNPTRNDNELRAEAMDYHDRQPYSVLVGVLFTPFDSCLDGDPSQPNRSRSSFAQIVNVLRHRSGRKRGRDGAKDDPQLFETFFIGLYEHEGPDRGKVMFFDVETVPPQFGVPEGSLLTFEELVERIVAAYDSRNVVKPAWHVGASTPTLTELEQNELLPEDENPGEAEDDDEDD
jgi:hypothetical protein